jgi:hypothetical protein
MDSLGFGGNQLAAFTGNMTWFQTCRIFRQALNEIILQDLKSALSIEQIIN